MKRHIVWRAMAVASVTGLGCDVIAGINRDYRLGEGGAAGTGTDGGAGAHTTGSGGGSTSTGGATTTGGGGTGGITTTGGGGTGGITTTGGGGTGGITTTGGGGTGGQECTPNTMGPCYTGPAGTEGVGACKTGMAECTAAGTWGPCNGEVVPVPEQCDTPVDDNCNGTALDAAAGCICISGSSSPCYSGPMGTSGVGACKPGLATCDANGTGYEVCTGEVVPSVENCMTPGDEDCDGSTPACAGGQVWAKRAGDAQSQIGKSVSGEAGGEVFAGGYFYGMADFGGGGLISAGSSDAFIAKYGSAGALAWAKRYGDAGSQETRAVARDGAGGVAATGVFSGTIDFKPGDVSAPLTSAGSFDIFLAKIDTNGTTLWSKKFGNNTNQYGTDVAVHDNGDVVLAGYFGGQVDFGGGLLTAGGSDGCVARFAPEGTYKWGLKLGGAGNDQAYGVATQASGATVVTGAFTGTADFGTGSVTSAGLADIFLVSLDSGGVATWAKAFGGTSDDIVEGIDTAPVTGNIAIAGHFAGSLNFGGGVLTSSGGIDGFVAVFGPTGNHLWSKSFGSPADDFGRSVAFDPQGNLVVGGSFGGAPMSIDGALIPYTGGSDAFVAKFDTGSALTWAAPYGDGTNQVCYGVSTDGGGNVFLTGSFEGGINFGDGVLGSSGAEDFFLAKLTP